MGVSKAASFMISILKLYNNIAVLYLILILKKKFETITCPNAVSSKLKMFDMKWCDKIRKTYNLNNYLNPRNLENCSSYSKLKRISE